MITKFSELNKTVQVFKEESADANAIAAAGENFLCSLYEVPQKNVSLNFIRYQQFIRSATKSKFNLVSLPPTAAATKQHSFRTYHQVQTWYGIEKNPEERGWKKSKSGLTPVKTTKDPAPEKLLKFISCECKKGCVSACGCKKAGLKCSVICMYCNGDACSNVAIILNDSEDEDLDDMVQLRTSDVRNDDSGEEGIEDVENIFTAIVDVTKSGPST